jgi:hypothetical protein
MTIREKERKGYRKEKETYGRRNLLPEVITGEAQGHQPTYSRNERRKDEDTVKSTA